MSRRAAASTAGSLQFSLPITGKSLSNSELLKRLKALHEELSTLEQETVVTDTLDNVRNDLIKNGLLLHKERAIKAYVGCCVVDILRLYAPDAPYNQSELRDVFQFLFRQLKNLSNPSDPHYKEYFYVIESLSNVKSIVIICDLDDGDELMLEAFKTVFDVVDSQTPTNLLLLLLDLLSQIILEAVTIPTDLIDLILSQFLSKTIKSNLVAFRLACDLCDATGDKLGKFVAQYFIEVFTRDAEDEEEEDEDEDSDEDSDGGKKKKGKKSKSMARTKSGDKEKGEGEALPSGFSVAHSLIVQLHASCPSLLLNVIPLLITELTASSAALRQLATSTLAKMLAQEPTVKSDLVRDYSGVWKDWLGRSVDRDWRVREKVAAGLGKIWKIRQELGKDIEESLKKVLLDQDDRVRASALQVFVDMDYELAWNAASVQILRAVSERCADRKAPVRNLAFKALGRLYDLAVTDIESKDDRAIAHFGWIPGALARALLASTDPSILNSIRATLDSTFLDYILPQQVKEKDLAAPGKEEEWVDRLLIVLGPLQDEERAFILQMTRLREKRPGAYGAFINVCEKNNGGVIDADADNIKAHLKQVIKALSNRCPDSAKATEDFGKFAKANEKQLYKLLRTLLDAQTELKVQAKTYKDALKRLNNISTSVAETFTLFIRQSCYLIINRSSIPTLLKRLQQPATTEIATVVLDYITKSRPILYKAHLGELTKSLGESNTKEVVTVALHCASRLFKVDEALQPEKKLLERAQHYAKTGTPAQAKYAATIVALANQKPGEADDLVDFLADELPGATEEELVARLAALNRIARFAKDSFEVKSEEITTSILEILGRDLASGEVVDNDDDLWVEDEVMDDLTKARVLGIKVLASRCIAFADEPITAETVAAPAFEMLSKFLKPREESSRYNAPVGSRLRLAAATSILKLATKPIFHKDVFKSFEQLSRMAQDTCFEVRDGFIKQLLHYLRTERISAPRLNMILFIVAHDPEEEIKVEVSKFVRSRFRQIPINLRQINWEHPFVRLAHLIARHPDFVDGEVDEDSVKAMSKYLELYFDCIATKENISYLYHLSLKLKTVRDSESEEFDKTLYVIAELAQYLIRNKAKALGGTITTFPEAVKMPGDIFRTMPNAAVANKVSKTSYLSSDLLARIGSEIGKPVVKVAKVKAEPKAKVKTTPKKRSSPKPKRVKKKKDGVESDHSSDDGVNDATDDSDDEEEDAKPSKKAKASPIQKENPAPQRKRAALGRSAKASPTRTSRRALSNIKDQPLATMSDSDEEMAEA